MGATNGVSILISQAIGAKDKKKNREFDCHIIQCCGSFLPLVTILLEAFLPEF